PLFMLLSPPTSTLFPYTTLFRSRRMCEAYGAKLIILVPPTPASEDAVHEMTLASRSAGVETLVPLDPAVLPANYYQADAIHLNSEGAAIFTVALATCLPRQLLGHDAAASRD